MRHSRAIVLLLCEAGLLLAKHTWAEPGAQGDEGARAGAWDRSHALEQSGKLDQARHLLMAGWGSEPDNYDVALRLAWLSLRARDYERAVELYRKARSLAGESPEAAKGLASALAGLGHLELERSENEAARAAFREALSIDPQQHDAREGLRLIHEPGPVAAAWIAYLDNSIGSSSHRGAAVFTQVALPMGSKVRMRVAYRYARLQERGALGGGTGQGNGRIWTAHEVYVGAAWMPTAWGGAELMPIAIAPSDEPLCWGVAGRGWLGRRLGASVDVLGLRRAGGWGTQIWPMIYAWPTTELGLHAGVRITTDQTDRNISGTAGAILATGAWSLSIDGHVGAERWPAVLNTPAVLTLPETLLRGATASVLVSPWPTIRIGIAANYEFTQGWGISGRYWSMSGGLVYLPTW